MANSINEIVEENIDYVKNIAITSTMGPGIKISLNSFDK